MEGINKWRDYVKELENRVEKIEKSRMPLNQKVAAKIVEYHNYRAILYKNSPITYAPFTVYQELSIEERDTCDEENSCFKKYIEENDEKIKELKNMFFYLSMEGLGWELNCDEKGCVWEKMQPV